MLRDTIICFSMGLTLVLGFGRTPSNTPYDGGNRIPAEEAEAVCYATGTKAKWDEYGATGGWAFDTSRDPDKYCMKLKYEYEAYKQKTYLRATACWTMAKEFCTESRANLSGDMGMYPEAEVNCSYYRPRLQRRYAADTKVGLTKADILAAMETDILFDTCTSQCGPCSTPEDRGMNRDTMSDDEQRADALVHCSPCRRNVITRKQELTFKIGKSSVYCPCKMEGADQLAAAEAWAIDTYGDALYSQFAPGNGSDPNDPYCAVGSKGGIDNKWHKNFCPTCVDNTAGGPTRVANCKKKWKKKHPELVERGACGNEVQKCPEYCRTLLETDIGCPPMDENESTEDFWPYNKLPEEGSG